MKYSLESSSLIEFNDSDIIKLLNFGCNYHPNLLPKKAQTSRGSMLNFKRSLDDLAYYYFKEILHAI